jgi:hypothetical protein
MTAVWAQLSLVLAGDVRLVRAHAWLKDQGFRVLRFWNNEVLSNTAAVLENIAAALSDDPSPGPPHRGGPPSPTRGEGTKSK